MMGTLADQLKSAGYSSKKICQYDVYSIKDLVIVFPEERLSQKRTKHDKRLVIILQNDKDNTDPTIKICSVAPLSTSKRFYHLDYCLQKKEFPFLREDSYIRIGHVQPILKADLETKFGNVTDQSTREAIQDRLFLLHE